MNTNQNSHGRVVVVAFLLGALVMGWARQQPNQANAETRRASPTAADQHFKSGGRLAESVLQEILVVLKRIDDRLARLEAGSKPGARGFVPNASPGESGTGSASGTIIPELKVRRGS